MSEMIKNEEIRLVMDLPEEEMTVAAEPKKRLKIALPNVNIYKVASEVGAVFMESGRVLVKTGMYVGAGLFWLNAYSRMQKGGNTTPASPRIEVRIHDASAAPHDIDVMYNKNELDVHTTDAFNTSEITQMSPEEVKASNDLAKSELEAYEAANTPADEAIAE